MTPGRVEFAQDAEIVVKNDTEMRLSIFTAIWLSLACFAPVGAETLRVGVADLPAQLDPALDRSPAGDAILPAMCDTLVALDAAGRPVPALATGWNFAADLRTLTLDLRKKRLEISFGQSGTLQLVDAAQKFQLGLGRSSPMLPPPIQQNEPVRLKRSGKER